MAKFNLTYQRHIVSTLLKVPGVLARVSPILEPEFFSEDTLSDIVALALHHWKKNQEVISFPALTQELDDESTDELIEELWNDDTSDSKHVVESIVSFVKQRAVEKAVVEAAQNIANGDHDGILKMMQDALAVGEDFSDIGSYIRRDVDSRMRDYIEDDVAGVVPTGLGELDSLLNGGLQPGTLVAFLGAPKSGKSALCCVVGANAALYHGVNVVHYTLELSPKKTRKRYDTSVYCRGERSLQVYGDITKNNPRKYVKQLARKYDKMQGDVLVKGYRTRTAGVSTIRSHLHQVVSMGFSPGLVVVDYADIMKPERRTEEMRHQQAGIYEDLRALAQEFNLPVLTASQANRASLNKPVVTMQDVSESFEKAAVVDGLIALCQTDDEKEDNVGRLFGAAMREGGDGRIINCVFDPYHMRYNTDVEQVGNPKKRASVEGAMAKRRVKGGSSAK